MSEHMADYGGSDACLATTQRLSSPATDPEALVSVLDGALRAC